MIKLHYRFQAGVTIIRREQWQYPAANSFILETNRKDLDESLKDRFDFGCWNLCLACVRVVSS